MQEIFPVLSGKLERGSWSRENQFPIGGNFSPEHTNGWSRKNDHKPACGQMHFAINLPTNFSTNFPTVFHLSVHFEASVAAAPITEVCCPHTMEECPYYPCPLSDPWVSLCRLLGLHWAGGEEGVHNTWHRPPPTWHPASPPCSRPSDPAATADESGPRSAPDPSQPVENFPLHPDGQQ